MSTARKAISNAITKSFVCARMDSFINWEAAGETFDFHFKTKNKAAERYRVFVHENSDQGYTHNPDVMGYLNSEIDFAVTAGTAKCWSHSKYPMNNALFHDAKQRNALLELPQWTKSTMGYMLQRSIHVHAQDVMTPKTYFCTAFPFGKLAVKRGTLLAGLSGEFVIKPNIGSRSRGHIYFTVNTMNGQDMGQALTEITNEIYDWKVEDSAPAPAGAKTEVGPEFKLSDKVAHRYNAVYHGGINKEDREGIKFLQEGWVLQNRIRPLLELRVFKGYHTIDAVMHRPHVKDGGLNIITSDWDVPLSQSDLDEECMNKINEAAKEIDVWFDKPTESLSDMVKRAIKVCPNFNSIDIGFTIVANQLRVVIYEHSSQFSCADLGTGVGAVLFRRWWAINLIHKHLAPAGSLDLEDLYLRPITVTNHLSPTFERTDK